MDSATEKIATNLQNANNLRAEVLRYLSFWKLFLLSFVICLTGVFVFLRYTPEVFLSSARYKIIDKSMDSEMSLPTAMTIFNRSLVNLDNEIALARSYQLISKTIKDLNANIEYFSEGSVISSLNHESEWLNGNEFEIYLTEGFNNIKEPKKYTFEFSNNQLKIESDNADNFKNYSKKFDYNSLIIDNNLPFEFVFKGNIKEVLNNEFYIIIYPLKNSLSKFSNSLVVSPYSADSDILDISMKSTNKLVSEGFINKHLENIDNDGISDRKLVFKSTIDFVNSRFDDIQADLTNIELKKQNFKEETNISDIEIDVVNKQSQKTLYDNELFNLKTQLELSKLLSETISIKNYSYLPSNIGLDNSSLDLMVSDFNKSIREYDNLISNGVGENNSILISLRNQIDKYYSNIELSLNNYVKSTEVKLNNLEKKNNEYAELYNKIPFTERKLRAIEREQEIKEALFLLLLQKREEASINFSVTKPSIKIIDYASSLDSAIYPLKNIFILAAILISIFIPFGFLFIKFSIDNKIHTKKQLETLLPNSIILGEIPFVEDKNRLNTLTNPQSRDNISESIRIANANLRISLNRESSKKVILVSSTIKGEGKTFFSTNLANLLSSDKKVILLGADLRNPQIHKQIGVEKNKIGLSDYLYRNDLNDYKKLIINHNENFDILLSGTIPPNPISLLSSEKLKNLILKLREDYDFIIIDSAPCLLVSDTFELSNHVDASIFMVRANFFDSNLSSFINEIIEKSKLKNLNLVFNGVGNSSAYGYKYGYQYGYGYGYNYGYGYGYGSKK